jgi:hypothetical protein
MKTMLKPIVETRMFDITIQEEEGGSEGGLRQGVAEQEGGVNGVSARGGGGRGIVTVFGREKDIVEQVADLRAQVRGVHELRARQGLDAQGEEGREGRAY